MTSLDSIDSQWGLTVSQYLTVGPRRRLSELEELANKSARGESLVSMEDFLAQTSRFTPLPVLLDVLSLAQSPRHLSQFNNTGIIPACLRLLRQYAQGYNKLFDRTYGLLCLDLLSVALQVGMLAQRGRLSSLVASLRARQMAGSSVRSILEEHTTQAIHDAMHADDYRKEIGLLLGWSYSKFCLPLCGGVSKDNVMFLLELLWEDRKSFLTVGSSHLSPRYSPIIFVLWQSLVHIESVSKAAWNQLHNLVYRCCLFARPSETLFLQKIAFHTEDQIEAQSIDWPDNTLDSDDSRNIINAYIRRLTLDSSHASLLAIKFATCFYDFVFHNVTQAIQDLIPELLRASMIRLWAEFEDTSPMRGRLPWVVRYAARTFQWAEFLRDEITVNECKWAFANVLFEQDFVNLAARSLFMTSTQETGFPPSDSVLEEIADDWDCLTQSITLFSQKEEGDSLVPTGLFCSMIPELVKALVYQHLLTFSFERGSHPRKRSALVMNALMKVGETIGWLSRELELRCCSPRCADPGVNGGVRFLCSRCQKATYCSERCQKIHFLLETSDSHKSECIYLDDVEAFVPDEMYFC